MANEHLGLYGIPSFFPTPELLARKLIALADIQPSDIILEPSAGSGAIAKIIRQLYPANPLLVIEKDILLRMELLLQGFNVIGKDFFTYTGQVDVVIQNPPFSNNYQDANHFCQAWRVLKPGGRVVSLLHEYTAYSPSSNPDYKPTKFNRWMASVGLSREKIPEGSFLTSDMPTNTRIALVWGTKHYGSNYPAHLRQPESRRLQQLQPGLHLAERGVENTFVG